MSKIDNEFGPPQAVGLMAEFMAGFRPNGSPESYYEAISAAFDRMTVTERRTLAEWLVDDDSGGSEGAQ